MAFRRFTRSRFSARRSFSSRSRRGSMRKPGDRKWEKSQFFVSTSPSGIWPAGASSSQIGALHLASIGTSLAANTTSISTGVALAQMARKLLIGGIEFDWGLSIMGPAISAGATPVQSLIHHQVGLCTDRIVTESGVSDTPNFILAGWNPLLSAFPTSILSSSTPTTALGNDDQDRPVHVHWKDTQETINAAFTLAVSEDLLVPLGQPVRVRRGHVSKRLRLVLGDHEGLYFYHALQNSSAFNAGSTARGGYVWFAGTLFWKYVF